MTIQKIKAGRVNGIDADNFVGDIGQLFYNEGIGDLRVSDGVTAGGIPLSFGGGGGGGNYTLPTATTTVKGGVKIDGSTITIANQVISVGTVPYNKISGTPTIPTDNSQLANSSGYITSSALTGLATQNYVTSRGYLTSVSWDDVSSKPALFNGAYASLTGKPTLFSGSYTDLTNQPTLFSGSYTDLTNKPTLVTSYTQLTDKPTLFSGSYTDLTGKPALFSGSYTDLTNKPTIPTDINQLTDASGLLGQGGGTGNYTLPTATDTVLGGVKIGSNISINAGVISVAAPFSGSYTDLTNKPTLVTSYTQLTDKPSIPSITGLATETYVTTRGYLTAVDYSIITGKPTLVTSYTQLTDKPTLFSGSYTDLTSKPTLFSGSYTDLTDKPSIPSITGLATETYVTTRGYLTAVDYSIITNKPALFSGSYTDLSNKPTIPAAQIQSDWSQTTNTALDYIKNKPTLFSGSYTDLSNLPTLVTSYNSLTDLPTLVTSYTQLTDLPTIPSITGLATETYVTTQGYITSSSLTGLATETYVTTQGYITSSALTGLATESFVTTQGYLTAVDYGIITNTPVPYTWSIAADDSTLKQISSGESVKFSGSSGISVTSDAEGNITISGPDLSTYATQNYVDTTVALISAGVIVSDTAPTGQVNGKLWYNSANLELYIRYDDAWVAASASFSGDYADLTNKPTNVSQFANDAGYVSREEVYSMILELAG